MVEAPEMQGQMVSSHGLLAILEVLESKPARDVILRLLQIVNLVGHIGSLYSVWKNNCFVAAGDVRSWYPGELLSHWVSGLICFNGHNDTIVVVIRGIPVLMGQLASASTYLY
jgi:hypothetical protein